MAYPTSSTRVGYVGTESIGAILTKANFDKGPGGLVAYNQITTNTGNFSSGVTTVTGLSSSFTAGTNRMYVITVFAGGVSWVSGTLGMDLCIADMTGGSGSLASNRIQDGITAGVWPGGTVQAYHQPSAGSQTYAARATVSAGVGFLLATSATNAARTCNILVQDVGLAF